MEAGCGYRVIRSGKGLQSPGGRIDGVRQPIVDFGSIRRRLGCDVFGTGGMVAQRDAAKNIRPQINRRSALRIVMDCQIHIFQRAFRLPQGPGPLCLEEVVVCDTSLGQRAQFFELDGMPMMEFHRRMVPFLSQLGVAHNMWRDHDQDFAAIQGFGLLPEEGSHGGQAAQEGDLRGIRRDIVADQAADDHGRTIVGDDVGGDFRHFLVGQREPPFHTHRTGRQFGVNFHPDQPVIGDKRPDPQLRADFQKFDRLRGRCFGNRRTDVTQFGTNQNFRSLLVQDQQARCGDHVGIANRLQGVQQETDAAVEDPDFQSPVAEIQLAQGEGRIAGDDPHVVMVLQQLEVHPQLIRIV